MNLHIHTPLLRSNSLSKATGKKIYFKIEALQPSGSFKDRGIGTLCQYYALKQKTGFVCASGGNAGMAVAYASNALQIPATIVLPHTTPAPVIKKLQQANANVIINGKNWNQANSFALTLSKEKSLCYIPPFDHPLIWEGHATIVKEIQKDEVHPDAIILSVGGGGLYSGIVQGLQALKWNTTTIITSETVGAASFHESLKAHKRIQLPSINTIAVTLGAKQICQNAFDMAQRHPTISQTVSDAQAVKACFEFLEERRILVEPACGAALAVAYENRAVLQPFKTIVIIVCGGSGVSFDLLQQWARETSLP